MNQKLPLTSVIFKFRNLDFSDCTYLSLNDSREADDVGSYHIYGG